MKLVKESLSSRLIRHADRNATKLEHEAAARIVKLESFAEFVRTNPLSADLRELATCVLSEWENE